MRKRAQKGREAMAKHKTAPLEELPREKLGELIADGMESCTVKVYRVIAGARRSSCGSCTWRLDEILKQDFEDWISDKFGGGQYLVDLIDLTTGQKLTTTFRCALPGDPKLTPSQEAKYQATVADANRRGQVPPTPQGYMMQQERPPLTADGRVFQPNPESLDPRRYWTKTPDQAFEQQVYSLDGKLEKIERERDEERKRLEKERAEWARQEREWMQKLMEMQNEFRSSQEAERTKLLEQRMEDLKAAQQNKPNVDWAALLAAAVPVLTAYMTTTKSQELERQKEHNESVKLQQKQTENILNMMAAKGNSETEALKAIMPMVTKAMNDKSPAAQATLMEAVNGMISTNLSLVHQIISANQPENPPAWLPVVESALSGLGDVVNSFTAQHGARQSQQPLPVQGTALARPQPQAQSQQQQQVPQQEAIQQIPPDKLATMILAHEQWPQDMKTTEWYSLLVAIHTKQDAVDVATELYEHLDKLDQDGLLPEWFAGVWENTETVMGQWLGALPIAQLDTEYVGALLSEFVHLVESELEEASEDLEEVENSGNGVDKDAEVVNTVEQRPSDVYLTSRPKDDTQ